MRMSVPPLSESQREQSAALFDRREKIATGSSLERCVALDRQLELGDKRVISLLHFGGVRRLVLQGLDEIIHGLVDLIPHVAGLLLQRLLVFVPRRFKLLG